MQPWMIFPFAAGTTFQGLCVVTPLLRIRVTFKRVLSLRTLVAVPGVPGVRVCERGKLVWMVAGMKGCRNANQAESLLSRPACWFIFEFPISLFSFPGLPPIGHVI